MAASLIALAYIGCSTAPASNKLIVSSKTTYISLLRGINVSGQKSIKMADLKKLYESLGFNDVVSYLQSGNVVFSAPKTATAKLETKIQEAIQKKYGFDVAMFVLEPATMHRIRQTNPYLKKKGIDLTRLYVTFLAELSSKLPAAANLTPPVGSTDEFKVGPQEIYLHCPGGYGKSKLSNNFFEAKLKVQATTRNWNTVCALDDMAGAR